MKNNDLILPILALAIYIIGGIGIFGGLGLIILMKGKDFFHWGDGRTVGYLFLFPGLCLSFLGVLLMRIARNRPPK